MSYECAQQEFIDGRSEKFAFSRWFSIKVIPFVPTYMKLNPLEKKDFCNEYNAFNLNIYVRLI